MSLENKHPQFVLLLTADLTGMQPTHLINCPTSSRLTAAAAAAGANTQSASSQKTSTESMNVFRCVGIPSAAGIPHPPYGSSVSYLVHFQKRIPGIISSYLSFITNQMCLSPVEETFPPISSGMRWCSAGNFCGGHGSKVKATAP